MKSTPAFSKQLLYESNNEHYWTPFFCRIKCIFLRNDLRHTQTLSTWAHTSIHSSNRSGSKGWSALVWEIKNLCQQFRKTANLQKANMYIHLCSMFAHALMEVGVQQSTRRRLLRHVSLGFWRLRAGRNDTNILLGSDCNVKMSRCQVTMTMGLQVACLLRRRTRAKLYTVELPCSLETHGKQ